MDDTQNNAVACYVEQVKQRFIDVVNLIRFLPSSTPHFFPDDIIDRMPDADKKELLCLLANAENLRKQVSQCEENIFERQCEAIQRAGDVENGKPAPAEATPLFLIVHGLFDETIRLSALAMQSISLSKDIARLLEKASTPEEADQARAGQNTKLDEILAAVNSARAENKAYAATAAEKMDNIQGVIEDKNRHRGEKWATVPDCIRATLDAVKLENNDGKSLPEPGNTETLRIAVQDYLKSKQGQRNKKKSAAKQAPTYYPIADIAEAMAAKYSAFTAAQYIREFESFGCAENDLHRAPRSK